jgi:hypothetical protein
MVHTPAVAALRHPDPPCTWADRKIATLTRRVARPCTIHSTTTTAL